MPILTTIIIILQFFIKIYNNFILINNLFCHLWSNRAFLTSKIQMLVFLLLMLWMIWSIILIIFKLLFFMIHQDSILQQFILLTFRTVAYTSINWWIIALCHLTGLQISIFLLAKFIFVYFKFKTLTWISIWIIKNIRDDLLKCICFGTRDN